MCGIAKVGEPVVGAAPKLLLNVSFSSICSEPDCEDEAVYGGKCWEHAGVKLVKVVKRIVSSDADECEWPNCTNDAVAGGAGYCEDHRDKSDDDPIEDLLAGTGVVCASDNQYFCEVHQCVYTDKCPHC